MGHETETPDVRDLIESLLKESFETPKKVVISTSGLWSTAVESEDIAVSMSTDSGLVQMVEDVPRTEDGKMIAGSDFIALIDYIRKRMIGSWRSRAYRDCDLEFLASERWISALPGMQIETVSLPYRVQADHEFNCEFVETVDILSFRLE